MSQNHKKKSFPRLFFYPFQQYPHKSQLTITFARLEIQSKDEAGRGESSHFYDLMTL